MTYELRLPPDTQNEIREFITSRYSGAADQQAALRIIEQELTKLSVNPVLGRRLYGGPFESRPVYRFAIKVDDTTRYVQVIYKVHKNDKVIVIAGFAPVQF